MVICIYFVINMMMIIWWKKSVWSLFETAELNFNIVANDYKQYVGSIPEEVQKNYDEHRSMLLFDLVTAKRETLPLVIVCFHLWMVSTRYNLKLKILRIDSWRVVQLLQGYLIFQLTSSSSFNAIFYCATRIVLDVCSSVMLFVWWTANRLFPKRRVMHRAIIGSWTKRRRGTYYGKKCESSLLPIKSIFFGMFS